MRKQLLLTTLITFFISLTTFAGNHPATIVELLYSDSAVIGIAQPQLPGSSNYIVIDGENYKIAPITGDAQTAFTEIAAAYTRLNQQESQPGSVVGFIVKEKGMFPNPTVEFEVFKALVLDIPIPE